MKHIQINLSDAEFIQWKAYCQQQQKTGTKILRNFIQNCFDKNLINTVNTTQAIDFSRKKHLSKQSKKQINLRLNEHELFALHEKSHSLGYSHPNHWIRQILEKALFENDIYNPVEISALQKATAQLWGIGHNLNQITKAIHINFQNHHQLSLEFLKKLENSIQEVIQKIDALCLKRERL